MALRAASSRRCSRPRCSRATPPGPARGSASRLPRLQDPRGLRLSRAAVRREAARSCTSRSSPGSKRQATSASSARPAPARPTARSRSASRPASAAPRRLRDRPAMGRPARGRPGPQPLEAELSRLERYHLLIVDEVGYLPLERQAANLLFALVSAATNAARSSSPPTEASIMGRDPRRRNGRRRPDRPARPPRHDDHPQRQELPAQGEGHRRRAGGRDPARRPTADDLNHGRRPNPTGALFASRNRCTIQFLLTRGRPRDRAAQGFTLHSRTVARSRHD